MSNLKEADRIAKKLKKVLDADLRSHGGRSNGDEITESVEYFDIGAIVEAYEALREHQRVMRKVLKAIREAGSQIKWYDLDKL